MFAFRRTRQGEELNTTVQAQQRSKGARKPRRGLHTRKQILNVSLRLFSHKGFARTSVRDIARAAGITDAAIYYHFSSKRDLFEALFEEVGITPALSQLEQATITKPPIEVLPAVAAAAVQLLHRNRDLMKVILCQATRGDPVASDEYRRVTDRWRRGQARILQEYVRRGDLRPLDADLAAHQLVVLAVGPFVDALMSGQAQDRPKAAPELVGQVRSAVEHFVQGLQARLG